jgi:hypothetical protein
VGSLRSSLAVVTKAPLLKLDIRLPPWLPSKKELSIAGDGLVRVRQVVPERLSSDLFTSVFRAGKPILHGLLPFVNSSDHRATSALIEIF